MPKGEQMTEDYQIIYIEKPEDSVWGLIGGGIDDFNRQNAGDYHFHQVCVGLQAPDQQMASGAIGELADFPVGHRRVFMVKEL